MSGNNRKFNRFPAGKSDFRNKHTTNAGSQMEWKPKPKIVSDGGSCSQKDNEECSVNDVASGVKDLKLVSNPLDDDDRASKKVEQFGHKSQKDDGDHVSKTASDGSLACSVNDVASGVKDLKSILNSLDNDGVSKKANEFGDKSHEDDGDHVLSKTRFDICPKSNVFKLKPSLHATNREKRNQSKRSIEGQNIKILRPGMVLMKGYISCDDQISIVKTCRDLGIGDGGFYQPGYREGTKLHLKMMCLGKNWDPQSSKYSDTRPIDNAKPPGIPDKFQDLVKKALQDSNAHIEKINPKAYARENIPSMIPDICIVNFYTQSGMLGLHQDKDESAKSLKNGSPVVSFSIGGSAEFLYGDDRDIEKAEKVILESGDVLIFGGKSRLVFHGVTSINPEKAPISLREATDMREGRLNLTFRQF